jgi:hypothetical protein
MRGSFTSVIVLSIAAGVVATRVMKPEYEDQRDDHGMTRESSDPKSSCVGGSRSRR